MKNNYPQTVIDSLRKIGLYQYDNHHLYPKIIMDFLVVFINNLLKMQDIDRRKYLENKNNKLLKEIFDELKIKNIARINHKVLEEIICAKCKIKLNATKRTIRAEHSLFNEILRNDKPQSILARIENIADWKLNEPQFRLAVAGLLICAYINKQSIDPIILSTTSEEKISSVNELIVANKNNGCNIQAEELMRLLEITKEQFVDYVKYKFLPPRFNEADQQEFWKIIPDNLVA